MPRGGAHFSSKELTCVLSNYQIGNIIKLKPLSAGNRRAPKMVIVSDKGKFLLKRRPKGKDDIYRVAFAHSVQRRLAEKKFPVTTIVETIEQNNTILQIDNHIYECFKFVAGIRYDGSAEATIDTGFQLARFHKILRDFASQWMPLKETFHDSKFVRGHLKTIDSDKKNGNNKIFKKIVDDLMTLYNNASTNVNQNNFDSWQHQVVHSDWHPGNMLFKDKKIVAVLDFDSVRIAPAATDLANGILQFSIVANRPNPADWPDYFDQAKISQFFKGYSQVINLDKAKRDSIVDLMIETMIAEAVLPIAATGSFGHLSGFEFLKMIHRKSQWLDKNRKKLTDAIER